MGLKNCYIKVEKAVIYNVKSSLFRSSCRFEKVEGNITVPPLPSETVLASFPAHGYSMCFHVVNMGLQAAIMGSFFIVAMAM